MSSLVKDLKDQNYKPVSLINHVAWLLKAKNDSHLSELLDFSNSAINLMRHRKIAISPTFIVRAMYVTKMTIDEVLELSGIDLTTKD